MYEILKYFEYQFIDVYRTKINYYEIFFNMFFMMIIIILLIVFYWDNIYKKAKNKSKCNDILTIIEDNGLSSIPYVYSIIIIDNDIINSNNNNYLLKFTYDFKNMKTIVEYGNDDGKKNEVLLSETIINTDSKTVYEAAKKAYIDAKIAYEAKKPVLNDDILIYNIAIDNYEDARKDYDKEIYNEKSKKRYNYFDLRKMNTNYIEGIDMKIINSHKYKYLTVYENNNKRKKNFTSDQLLFFTKGYSDNLNYNTEIIYDIKFAKDNKNKLTI